MEKIFDSAISNFIFSGLVFFVQLYFRGLIVDLKRSIIDLQKNERRNDTAVWEIRTEISAIKTRCEERHRK